MATAVPARQSTERGGRFRVLVGELLEDGPPGCHCQGCEASGGKDHRYRAVVLLDGVPYSPEQIDDYKRRGGTLRKLLNLQKSGGDRTKLNPVPPAPVGPDNQYDGDIIDTPKDLCARLNQGHDPKAPNRLTPHTKVERVANSTRLPEWHPQAVIDDTDEWDPTHPLQVESAPTSPPQEARGPAGVKVVAPPKELARMTMPELRRFAADLDIDLSGKTTKEEIVLTIKKATE